MRNFCLEIKEYGEPEMQEHRRFITKYYDSWTRTCHQLAQDLPSLTNVAVCIVIPAPEIRFTCQLSLKAQWVAPLLEFAESKSLQSASVTLLLEERPDGLNCGCTEDTSIAFSEVLRRKMLGFDDEAALEALHDFKTNHPPRDCNTSELVWKSVGDANDIDFAPGNEHQ